MHEQISDEESNIRKLLKRKDLDEEYREMLEDELEEIYNAKG